MGYTHYWRRPKNADRTRFRRWAKDVNLLVRTCPHDVVVRGPDGEGDAEVAPDRVAFNGDAATGDDHESFWVDRTFLPPDWQTPHSSGRYFECCKTDRKPYDLVVCAALIRLHAHFPAWPIWSDGTSAEWWGAVKLCDRVFGPGHDLPPKIEQKPCDRCPIGLSTHAGSQYPGGPWVELCDECWAAIPVEEV